MAIALLVLLAFQSCVQLTFEEKLDNLYKYTVPLISSAELMEITQKKEVILLDTRAPEEFEVSHIEGAIFLNYNNFETDQLKELPKNTEIVVYCSVGYRSERIGEQLISEGYSNVHNLYGGIFDWKNKNNEVVNANNQLTDSVHTYNQSWSRWLKNGIKVYE